MLVASATVAFVALGVWQWDRSQSVAGDFQNLGYALQWPLFALFVVLAWGRWLWLESHRNPAGPDADPDAVAPRPPPTAPTALEVSRPLPVQEDDSDDELAAYNAFLARLAEQDRQR
ncbi:MAG: hypothetical protein GEV09_19730 [Pseudonocardiaceae bacterium]|nr:hypothetical protein [Pseudonocardiaceae bacterium]